jgi:acetyl-CoA carboxylase carboxyl transferase subunit beta
MSWIDRVRRSIPFVAKRETGDELWYKCPACGQMIFKKEYEENQSVCPKCDHHGRIGPNARFDELFDGGIYTLLPSPQVTEDPLRFRDTKRYSDRLKAARTATGRRRRADQRPRHDRGPQGGGRGAGLRLHGRIDGAGGRRRLRRRRRGRDPRPLPYIVFTAAGGARMQEGILSLMQMPRTTVAIQMLREARLPYIVVMTDPTTGGVTASYAMLGDVQLASPGA